MKIGLPRHITVIACPASTWEMSTSVEASDSADGVRVHLVEQRPQRERTADRGKAAGGDQDHVAPRRLILIGNWEICGRYVRAVGQFAKAPMIAHGANCISRSLRKIPNPRPPLRAGVALLRLELMPLPCSA